MSRIDGHGGEELDGLVDGHVEDVGDRLALELHFERFAVVALALAHVAGDVDVGQEVHLDLEDAVAFAFLAAPALDVEREPARAVAAGLGLGQAGKPVAQWAEGADIGGRVGSRRAADRRLVDVDDLVEEFEAGEVIVRGRVHARAVEPPAHGLVQRVDHQRRLAAARDAGHRDEQAERYVDGDVLEVVAGSAVEVKLLALLAARRRSGGISMPMRPERYAPVIESGMAHDVLGRALGDDVAAVDASARTDVDDVVGGEDRVFVVLDDDDGVAEVAQAAQRLEQPRVVALVEANRRLVEDVEHAGEARADLAARRMRWLSPPDSEPELRASVR